MYKDSKWDKQVSELKEAIGVPFSEKRTFDCTDCCKCCGEYQCPYNETRCQ